LLTKTEIWQQLKKGKRYRREFAAQFSKRAIPQQIALLRKQFGITQSELAKHAGMTQGAVSRATDPEYGNLTVNTLVRIASGFDLVFVGTFVRWSELPRWFNRFYSEPFTVPSFEEEDAAPEEQEREQAQLATEIAAINLQTPVAEISFPPSLSAEYEAFAASANATRDLLAPTNAAFAEFVAAMARQLEATGLLGNPLFSGIIDTQQTTSPPQDNVLPGNFEQRATQRKANRSPVETEGVNDDGRNDNADNTIRASH
jgi:transcriptional regulator with XRE-family HTH domain